LEIIEAAALNASGGAGFDAFGVTQLGHPDPAP